MHVDGRFPMNDSGRVYDTYSSFFNKTPSIAFGKLPTNQGIVVGNLELFDVNGSAAAGQYRHFRRRRANGALPCSTRPPWRETERPYSNPEAAEELVQARLLIARCKARAYARRLSAARAAEVLTGSRVTWNLQMRPACSTACSPISARFRCCPTNSSSETRHPAGAPPPAQTGTTATQTSFSARKRQSREQIAIVGSTLLA